MASYSTTFSATENPLSESGAWQDGPGAWGSMQSAAGNSRPAATNTDAATRLNTAAPGATIGADQYAKGTIAADTGNENNLCCRINNSTDGDCYQLSLRGLDGVTKIMKVTDSGSLSFSQLGADIAVDPVNGDLWEFRVTGTSTTTLKAFKGGAQQGTDRTDSTSPFTSGQPGVGHYSLSTTNVGFTDWEGGDLSASVSETPLIGALVLAGIAPGRVVGTLLSPQTTVKI